MNSCKIEQNDQGFKISGVINFNTVMSLHQQGDELFSSHEKVSLDFRDVIQADSSAIALLLNWLRLAKHSGKSFIFSNLPGQILEIANVCEVMPYLSSYIKQTK